MKIAKKRTSVDLGVLHGLITTGNQMSNLCYNFSQDSWPALTKHDRETMALLVRQWDAKLNHLRETYK